MTQESVYNLVPEDVPVIHKAPRYKSQHKGTQQPTASTFVMPNAPLPTMLNMSGERDRGDYTSTSKPTLGDKRERADFGKLPCTNMPEPEDFLKAKSKNGRVATLAQLQASAAPETLKPSRVKDVRKPTVVTRDEKPIMNLCTKKNFIITNAVDNILMPVGGLKSKAELTVDYLKKQDYGEVPSYLTRVKSEIHEEYQTIKNLQDQENIETVRPLDEADKETLLGGLKAKWEEVNKEYQLGTHLTKLDTIGKIKRKEYYEKSLMAIEKDIEMLNKKNLYVDVTH